MDNKVQKLIEKIQKAIDDFQIVNSTTQDTIDNCQPYFELTDCETVDEIREYIEDYINNIDNAKESLQNFSDILDKIDFGEE